MIILQGHASTPDELEVVTGSATDIDVHISHVDSTDAAPPAPENPEPNNVLISTATTTVVATAPTSASKVRGIKSMVIRNRHASNAAQVTVQIDENSQGTDVIQLVSANLAAGEGLGYEDQYGFYTIAADPAASTTGGATNYATANSAAGFATDTYVTGSALKLLALGTVTVGRYYQWRVMISKTAAGTATPILTVRVGTAGTTADTARLTFTWGAGTAAVDRGEIELGLLVTTAGASGVIRGKANWTTNLSTTGLSNAVKSLQVTSAAFDLTVANSIIGLSYNGGTSASHTIEEVRAYTDQL